MAFDYHTITEIVFVESNITSIYIQTPPTTKTFIRLIILHNSSNNTENVIVYKVPAFLGSIGTATSVNKFIEETLAAGETILYEFSSPGIIMQNENDSIQAICTTPSSINIQIYGAKE